MAGDFLGLTAHEQSGQAHTAMREHHDQVRLESSGLVQHLCDRVPHGQDGGADLAARCPQNLGLALQVFSQLAALLLQIISLA